MLGKIIFHQAINTLIQYAFDFMLLREIFPINKRNFRFFLFTTNRGNYKREETAKKKKNQRLKIEENFKIYLTIKDKNNEKDN